MLFRMVCNSGFIFNLFVATGNSVVSSIDRSRNVLVQKHERERGRIGGKGNKSIK